MTSPSPVTTNEVKLEKMASLFQHIQISKPGKLKVNNFPNFLILGPQRTGTTWLFHNLKKHPQIFLPRKKESYYFTTLGRPDHIHHHYDTLDDFLAESMSELPRRWLKKQYDCLRKYRQPYQPVMRGEATASNALLPVEVIQEITALRPDLKAILMLRNPIERAWSHAQKDLVRNASRRLDEISRDEFERFFRAAGQRALAAYADQVRRWSDCLEPGHLFIGEFEMISSAPDELLSGIHHFLGIRSGGKFINHQLLRERINPSDNKTATSQSAIPPEFHEYLTVLLEEELFQYNQVRTLLDSSTCHQAVRELKIKPISTAA